MKKGMVSIINIGKKKTGAAIFCMVLTIALTTSFTACSNSNPSSNSDSGNVAAVTADSGSPASDASDTLSSGTKDSPESSVAVDDLIQFGGVDWRVLEIKDEKALVLSDKILAKKQYYSNNVPISWEECELRQYLNGAFYDSTFSEEEKKQIIETTIVNNNNPWFPVDNPTFPWRSTPGGNDTTDKLFLLSIDEVLQYFGDSGEVASWAGGITFVSDEFNEARVAETQAGVAAWWWLRSPGLFYSACGANFSYAACVAAFGGLSIEGDLVQNGAGGVRPAMWLDLSGTGLKEPVGTGTWWAQDYWEQQGE